jgi:hypothetical protein
MIERTSIARRPKAAKDIFAIEAFSAFPCRLIPVWAQQVEYAANRL